MNKKYKAGPQDQESSEGVKKAKGTGESFVCWISETLHISGE